MIKRKLNAESSSKSNPNSKYYPRKIKDLGSIIILRLV
jgi:hypothetical protein